MVNLEKRFNTEKELQRVFLGTVLHVYDTPTLRNGDLVSKLEPAFHLGLCHPDQELRSKFFAVFNRAISKNPYDRLWHIMCLQNWEPMQGYFWIKICINVSYVMFLEDSLKITVMLIVFSSKKISHHNRLKISQILRTVCPWTFS